MLKISQEKYDRLIRLSDKNGIIRSLAMDQRNSLKRMLSSANPLADTNDHIKLLKELISEELTPFATSILLDPEYGLSAAQKRSKNTGLILSYEKPGYDRSMPGHFMKLADSWSVKRLKEAGADAVKFLLYFDVDEGDQINDLKKVLIERIGSECASEGLVFFLEILTYDSQINDTKGIEYAKIRPYKVIEAMKIFSDPRFQVDVLKVEFPVNIHFVEGYATEAKIFNYEEAIKFFKEQSEATDLPFIFLSGGLKTELFLESLKLANASGSKFNGVLCGRATWKDSVSIFAKNGKSACKTWLSKQGRKNIEDLNHVLDKTAESWLNKVKITN